MLPKSYEAELVEDMVSLMASFSAKVYGKRSAENRKRRGGVKKSRFLYLHESANSGKVAALDALQTAYTAYLGVCVETMLGQHRLAVPFRERQAFFPACSTLSSQIVKNIRDHAIGIVSGWAASKYTVKLKAVIKQKFKDGDIDEPPGLAPGSGPEQNAVPSRLGRPDRMGQWRRRHAVLRRVHWRRSPLVPWPAHQREESTCRRLTPPSREVIL